MANLQGHLRDINNNILFTSNAYILWENPDPTKTFTSQTITLSKAIEKFKFYTVIYTLATDNPITQFSNTVKSGCNQRMSFAAGNKLNWRSLIEIKGTKCTFNDNVELQSYGGNTIVANQRCIPLIIIGHN